MVRVLLIACCCCLLAMNASAQCSSKYFAKIRKAEEQLGRSDFEKSLKYYEKAFHSCARPKWYDVFFAAETAARLGQREKSLQWLERLVHEFNFEKLDLLEQDSLFAPLHVTPTWSAILDEVREKQRQALSKQEPELIAMFDSIRHMDQDLRILSDSIDKTYGYQSPEAKACWKNIETNDSLNQIKVVQLIEQRGWLGTDVIGEEGVSTLFLVIQHAPYDIQKKYLPLFREAVARDKAEASNLAMMEDRVAVNEGQEQVYGTQIGRDDAQGLFYVLPLKDPKHVDDRRAAMGLGPMSEYTSIWEIPWSVKEYKRRVQWHTNRKPPSE